MVLCNDLLHYLNTYLQIDKIKDYAPIGLQVEGRSAIHKIITSVSASAELFDRAAQIGADLVMVHHGMFWERDSRVITGGLKTRLKTLLINDISLLCYHLALDKHPVIGNNILAAKALGLKSIQELGEFGLQGKIAGLSLNELIAKVAQIFQPSPRCFPYGPIQICKIGYCSGGAERDIIHAIEAKLDAFITGEVSEATMHLAKEGNIHFIAAGHYATERLGIHALGQHVAENFKVKVEFVDIPNPI